MKQKNLRENMVKNQGIAKSSGMKFMSNKWFARTGSWNAISWENFAKYSWMIAELSLRKNLCKYFGTNSDKQANALAAEGNKELH